MNVNIEVIIALLSANGAVLSFGIHLLIQIYRLQNEQKYVSQKFDFRLGKLEEDVKHLRHGRAGDADVRANRAWLEANK